MNMVQEWYNGNFARVCFPGLDLSSQRISELLQQIGDEGLWRKFFIKYTQTVYSNNGVIIDSTGLPSDINANYALLDAGYCNKENIIALYYTMNTRLTFTSVLT